VNNLIFLPEAWDDYNYWKNQDKKTLNRINFILKDILRNSYSGIGKPERLSGDMSDWYSRRIDDKNRIVYRTTNGGVEIAQLRSHYSDH
jgi:toxin YoeB